MALPPASRRQRGRPGNDEGLQESHVTLEPGQGHALMSSGEGVGPQRELLLGGVHHLSHEEGTLGVSVVDDDEEGAVEVDTWGHRHGDGFHKRGPGSFCPFLVNGQHSLMHPLQGERTPACSEWGRPLPQPGSQA